MKRTLTTLLAMALLATAASGAIFEQTDSTVWGEGGDPAAVSGSNPVTVTASGDDRNYAYVNTGLGVLADQTSTITWTFDVTVTGSDTWAVVLGGDATEGTDLGEGGGSSAVNGYIVALDTDDSTIAFGKSDRGGKNEFGQDGATALIDSALTVEDGKNMNVTVQFDPTGSEWTFNLQIQDGASFFTATPVADSEYTGADLSIAGLYNRDSTSTSLSNFTIVPEPMTLSVLALGGVALIKRRRR